MTDPPRPFVGIGCIIEREGRLLLMRRHGSHGQGTWSTPGGYLEAGESFEDCAVRETLEETGLDVTDISYFGVTNDIFPEDKKHFVTIWMRAGSATGEPTGSEESTEIGWFDPDRLPEPLFAPLLRLIQTQGLPEVGSLTSLQDAGILPDPPYRTGR